MILLLILLAQFGAPPQGQRISDYLKTEIQWTWAKGNGPNASGFRIYCGDVENRDATTQYFTEVVDVPDPRARSYLIGPTLGRIMTMYGRDPSYYGANALPGAKMQLPIICNVAAYNSTCESGDGLTGCPNPPTGVKW